MLQVTEESQKKLFGAWQDRRGAGFILYLTRYHWSAEAVDGLREVASWAYSCSTALFSFHLWFLGQVCVHWQRALMCVPSWRLMPCDSNLYVWLMFLISITCVISSAGLHNGSEVEPMLRERERVPLPCTRPVPYNEPLLVLGSASLVES